MDILLYRTTDDDKEFRRIDASIDASGRFEMGAQDMGPTVEEVWGDTDYEFGVRLTPKAKDKLLMALIEERYKGRSQAVAELRDLLQERGIEFEWWSWM